MVGTYFRSIGLSYVENTGFVEVDVNVGSNGCITEFFRNSDANLGNKRTDVVLNFDAERLGCFIQSLGRVIDISSPFENTDVNGIHGVHELKDIFCHADIFERRFFDETDIGFVRLKHFRDLLLGHSHLSALENGLLALGKNAVSHGEIFYVFFHIKSVVAVRHGRY